MATRRTRTSEIQTAFRNPDMGWVGRSFRPITRPNLAAPGGPWLIDVTPYCSSIYTNKFCWTDLEPTEGNFVWSDIDVLLDTWPNHTLRLGIAGPNEPSRFGFEGFPDWLRAACPFDYYDSASPDMYQPDYENATFQTKFANLLTAFAARYYKTELGAGENNWMERIPAIDINIFGRWGEWHSTNYTQWTGDTERFDTCKALVDIYYDAFNAAKGPNPLPEFVMNVIGASAYASEPYDPVAAFDTIRNRGTAMIRRAIGITSTNLSDDEQDVIEEHISDQSFEGEWGSFDGSLSWFRHSDPDAPIQYTWQAIDEAIALGCTHLGWYKSEDYVDCAIIDPDVDVAEVPEAAQCTVFGGAETGKIWNVFPLQRFYPGTAETLEDYAQRNLGYRFHIADHQFPSTLKAGGTLRLTQRWFQRAVAKLRKQHYVAARLVGASTVELGRDTSSLNAHLWREVGPCGPRLIVSLFTVPGGTPSGTYELQFAVTDSDGVPAMNVATTGKVTAGLADPVNDYSWYRVGDVTVP